MSVETGKVPPESRRLGGVDAARAVAVLGMVMVHFGPAPAPGTVLGFLYGLSYGRASVLFVLLAGVGVALLAGGGREKPRRPTEARVRLVLRAALLLPLGLWLQGLDHGVLVILQFYAAYFLLAALILGFPDLLLLAGAAGALVGGGATYLLVGTTTPGGFDPYPAGLGDPIWEIVRDLLLTGAYPVAVWSAPLFVGLWIGRGDLASVRTSGLLLAIGTAVAAAAALLAAGPGQVSGPAQILSGEPHGQMPLWMLGSIGSGCAVLGAALLLVGQFPRATGPTVAVGQMALTVYVGHLLLLRAAPGLLRRETVPEAFLSVGLFAALAAGACVLWRAALPRGPLEALFAAPWWAVRGVLRRLRGPRKTPPETVPRGGGWGP